MPIGTSAKTKAISVTPFWLKTPKDMIDAVERAIPLGYKTGNISFDTNASGIVITTLTIENPDLPMESGRRRYTAYLDDVLVYEPVAKVLTKMTKAQYDNAHTGTVWPA